MLLYKILQNILRQLKIKNYAQLALDIVDNDYHFFNNLFANLKSPSQSRQKILESDEEPAFNKFITYTDNNKKYTFELEVLIQKDLRTYTIIGSSGNSCIIFFIAKNSSEVRLHTISYFEDCAKEGLQYPGGGTVLLQFVLDFLYQHKDRLKINRITLKDNSYKICHPGGNIELSTMYFLMYGDTWYGKYGFRPYKYNESTNIKDINLNKILQQEYKDNQKIMKETLVSDVPQLENYIVTAFKKNKSNLKLANILKVYDIYKTKGKSLMKFIRAFLKYYDKTCQLFMSFYSKLAKDIKLTRFYGQDFFLNL
ncbi:MAG: hypothetical protein Hyperionvirus3_174 [Hyperionvirus sp.]|uniref:Uncharacterized protein n=1 Tax=Hyperionvirus sp. TaxID=2487770 RepID=A0A3G5A770_9VIRU|nr:MAG: hypothetical protein Hyperionvirus3_174 [Hyperionvirus sp.]